MITARPGSPRGRDPVDPGLGRHRVTVPVSWRLRAARRGRSSARHQVGGPLPGHVVAPTRMARHGSNGGAPMKTGDMAALSCRQWTWPSWRRPKALTNLPPSSNANSWLTAGRRRSCTISGRIPGVFACREDHRLFIRAAERLAVFLTLEPSSDLPVAETGGGTCAPSSALVDHRKRIGQRTAATASTSTSWSG